MARPPDKRILVTRDWYHQHRFNFLDAAFHHCPSALVSLRDDVLRNKTLSVAEWAHQFDLGGTWVEDWAAATIEHWALRPEYSDWPTAGPDLGKLFPTEPPNTKAPPLVLAIKWRVPRLGNRVTLLATFQDDLANLFEGWLEARIKDGSLYEIDEPKNLSVKFEVAALYYFGHLRPNDIAQRNGVATVPGSNVMIGDRTSVNRWLKEVSQILDLPLRKRGPTIVARNPS